SKALAVARAKHCKFEFMLVSLSSCFLFSAHRIDDDRDGRRPLAPARLPPVETGWTVDARTRMTLAHIASLAYMLADHPKH
ncbi:hypothetical protein, partial [Mesorhizobium amorphae]|uniref:hypothetical protein n=1 Tax=Mesorhizobium amorphae TaxID=71433 RepID=UPI0024E05DA5